MQASDVKEACEAWLEDRLSKIAVQVEKKIQRELGKLFFPARTREEALKRLSREIDEMYVWQNGYWVIEVTQLKDLASHSSDGFINITGEHLALIKGHLSNGQ